MAARVGATAIEIATGGQSRAPHLRLDELLADAGRRAVFRDAFASRGLRIAALNCSAWPLHPAVGDRHVAVIRSTIRLASELGVTKLVTMSGAPATDPAAPRSTSSGTPGRRSRWPCSIASGTRRSTLWRPWPWRPGPPGIEAFAFELHPLHLVYNVPTYERMRDAVGPVIGVNLDPSHLFWQGMDPIAVVRALGSRRAPRPPQGHRGRRGPGCDRRRPRPAPVHRSSADADGCSGPPAAIHDPTGGRPS